MLCEVQFKHIALQKYSYHLTFIICYLIAKITKFRIDYWIFM